MAPTGGETSAPGDLGRRVAQRRRELDLSREQLAERAGMAPGYVDYLEERAARVPIAGVGSLARALDTSTDELLGAPSSRHQAEATPRHIRNSRP